MFETIAVLGITPAFTMFEILCIGSAGFFSALYLLILGLWISQSS